MFVWLVLFSSVVFSLAPLHENGQIIPGHFIVVFKDEIADQTFASEMMAVNRVFGNRVSYQYKHTIKGYSLINVTDTELFVVRSNPNVKFVEADQIMSALCELQPCGSWGQTRISQVNLNLQNLIYSAPHSQGFGVDAYILDTGIYISNNDFTKKQAGTTVFGFKAQSSWTDDDKNGHGTHVASTIAGYLYGVAKKANLIAVKVLGDNGSGTNAGVIAGVDYVSGQRTRKQSKTTANMSLGGGFSSALNAAVDGAVRNGVIFVVAAGNDDDDACLVSPASAKDAITVGATSEGVNGDVRASYSNFGKCVDIFAPGSLITAAWIGRITAINTISGTSMASPHVCGVVTLLYADEDNLTPKMAKELITGDATKNKISFANCFKKKADCESSPNLMTYNGCTSM